MTGLIFRALGLAAPVVGRWPGPFYWIATALAALVWHVRPGLRRRLLKTQTIACRGDRSRARQAGRQALVNVVRYYVDLCTIAQRDMDSFERRHIEFIGGEHLHVLDSGRPVVALSAHIGSPELGVQAILGRGRSFVALVEPVRSEAYAALLGRLRGGAGGRYMEASPAGIRTCLETLRAGGIVALVGDRDIQGHGACTTLLGRKVRLPDGPFELARRTGAIVLPVLTSRGRRDQLTLFVEEPFSVDCDDGPEAVTKAVQRWAAILERHIARDPGQWTVTEDFWKVHGCG